MAIDDSWIRHSPPRVSGAHLREILLPTVAPSYLRSRRSSISSHQSSTDGFINSATSTAWTTPPDSPLIDPLKPLGTATCSSELLLPSTIATATPPLQSAVQFQGQSIETIVRAVQQQLRALSLRTELEVAHSAIRKNDRAASRRLNEQPQSHEPVIPASATPSTLSLHSLKVDVNQLPPLSRQPVIYSHGHPRSPFRSRRNTDSDEKNPITSYQQTPPPKTRTNTTQSLPSCRPPSSRHGPSSGNQSNMLIPSASAANRAVLSAVGREDLVKLSETIRQLHKLAANLRNHLKENVCKYFGLFDCKGQGASNLTKRLCELSWTLQYLPAHLKAVGAISTEILDNFQTGFLPKLHEVLGEAERLITSMDPEQPLTKSEEKAKKKRVIKYELGPHMAALAAQMKIVDHQAYDLRETMSKEAGRLALASPC